MISSHSVRIAAFPSTLMASDLSVFCLLISQILLFRNVDSVLVQTTEKLVDFRTLFLFYENNGLLEVCSPRLRG